MNTKCKNSDSGFVVSSRRYAPFITEGLGIIYGHPITEVMDEDGQKEAEWLINHIAYHTDRYHAPSMIWMTGDLDDPFELITKTECRNRLKARGKFNVSFRKRPQWSYDIFFMLGQGIFVNKMIFAPDRPIGAVFDEGGVAFNSFKGWGCNPVEPDNITNEYLSRLEEHLLSVACDGDQEKFDLINNWLGFMVQQPYTKVSKFLKFNGSLNSSKRPLARMLNNIVGRHHCLNVQDINKVYGRFNGVILNQILVNFDHCKISTNKQVVEARMLVKGPEVTVEEPYVNWKNYKNLGHVIIQPDDSKECDLSSFDHYQVELNFGNDDNTLEFLDENHSYYQQVCEGFMYKIMNRDLTGINTYFCLPEKH